MSSAPAHYSHSYDAGILERLLFKVARKWVAGNDQNDAIASALSANSRGLGAILNFLGEDATDPDVIAATVKEYSSLFERIGRDSIRGSISIKPSQFGLARSYDLCLENYRSIASISKLLGQFIWIDMESAKFVDDSLSVYRQLNREYNSSFGIAIQAYLRRSSSDLDGMLPNGATVRLVKGAYHETPEIAFSSRADIDANYSKLMRILFESGNRFAIATHDSNLIEEAISLATRNGKPDLHNRDRQFEFQMLMGIRDELKLDLVSKGFGVSEYIPYGSHWLPYSVRRLREHKQNILLLARSLF